MVSAPHEAAWKFAVGANDALQPLKHSYTEYWNQYNWMKTSQQTGKKEKNKKKKPDLL